MKRMKKLIATLLAAVMIMGMSVTALADEVHKPTNADKVPATVENVEPKATVTAYRIVEPTYDTAKGFTGYKAAAGVTLKDIYNPSSDEVTGIAANKELLATLTKEELKAPEGATELTTYSAQLGAGYWVVVVTGSEFQKIYNPMLIGVYYRTDGTGQNNTLQDSVSSVNAGGKWDLATTPAYAKSEEPGITKTITGSTGKDTSDGNDHGNDVAVGDTVNFQIETQIPSYSKSYTDVTVDITDELSKGLALADPVNLVVKVGGTTNDKVVTADADTYTYTPDTDQKGFTISFASKYALDHSGEKVYVTYDAVVGQGVGYDFDANTNTATLIYTNDPHDKNHTNEKKDKTYTYTFAIDTKLFGESGEQWNYLTEELLKTQEIRETVNGEVVITKKALEGAKFTLTRADGKVYEGESDANGYIAFTGLDAGTYELTEVEAPKGFSLNDAKIPVVISAEYNNDEGPLKGTLKSYTITVNGNKTSGEKIGDKKEETY